PAAARGLEQRVVEEEHQPSAGAEHPAGLVEGAVEVGDVLQHEAADHGVEVARGERQRVGRRPHVGHSPAPPAGLGDLGGRDVDAHHLSGAPCHRQAGDLALAATQVEHPGRTGQLPGGDGEDLVAVLDVRVAGEALLPPPGVALPHLDQVEVGTAAAVAAPGGARPRPAERAGLVAGAGRPAGHRTASRSAARRAPPASSAPSPPASRGPTGPWIFSYTATATSSGSQLSARSSSSEARFTPATPPSSLVRRLRRAGPRPLTSSSTDFVIRLPRSWRW